MADSLVQDLIEAGVHFGQRTSNWNPKMSPYIYGVRGGIHIIDIKETIKGLLLSKRFLQRVVADGKDVCFVGTKQQAKVVLDERIPAAKMHRVTERWLGGTLTNFRTIRSRLKRLEELEAIEAADNFESYSKKMESRLRREMRKIHRNLDGIRAMDKLPGALVVIDARREINAIREAQKLGIPVVCLLDTDADPDLADIAIPGNDDSMRSIDVIVRELTAAINDGRQARGAKAEGADPDSGDGSGQGQRRRSSRAQFRADDATPAPGEGDARSPEDDADEGGERAAAAGSPQASTPTNG